MVEGGGIDGHTLHDGEGLDGRISDVGAQHASEGQVLVGHRISWHQAAYQVSSLGSDIGHIQENLPRHLPLNTEVPVLNIRGASIAGVDGVNSTVESIGWVDERRSRELRSRPAVCEDESWIKSPVLDGQDVERVEPLYVLASGAALGASQRIQDPVTEAQHCLVV